jgi:N-acetylglucosaminyl-diphospho-decaprenol L-rhamnosyltransferase
MPQLSIIIVNWNSRDYLQKCLKSIYANTRGISFEIIVVDGGSFDGCGEMLAREFPEVKFVQSEKNVGFARANNLGFEQSQGDCILFLNPDTEVVGSAINVLHDALMKYKDAGGLTPKLLNKDLSLQTDCVQAVPTILNQAFNSEALKCLFPKAPFLGKHVEPVEIEVLPGSCILTRREIFEQVGRFAPEYFMRFLTKTRGRFYALGYRVSTTFAAICRLFLLGILLPVSVVCGELTPARNSFRKWMAILSWSLGAETWIRRYN